MTDESMKCEYGAMNYMLAEDMLQCLASGSIDTPVALQAH